MADFSPTQILGLTFGFALMLVGFYVLKRANIILAVRVALGLVMILAGGALGYWLFHHDLQSHPFLLGTAIGLLGLGVNQAASPLRVAMGKSA